jgi:CBS domain containing-hemolysin-like protein
MRIVALGLVFVFLFGVFSPAAFAIVPSNPEKIRNGIVRLGTGEQARVAVKLRNGTRLKGFVSSASEEAFTVSDLNTGSKQEVSYSDVAQVHGHNLTSGQKLAIGAVFIVAFIVALLLVAHSAR